MTATGGVDEAGAGDLLSASDAVDLGGALDLTGRNIDVRSTGGDIIAQADLVAGADIRLQTGAAGGKISTGLLDAGRDVLVDGASIEVGSIKALRDFAARARAGSISVGSIAAGDDCVLRATTDIRVTGATSASGGADSDGLGDRLFATDATTLGGASANTRWGSAKADGSIRLNWRLLHYRPAIIDYVVAHELAHLRVMDHSPRFWDTVPDLRAAGDIAIRARNGAISLGSAAAGDDLVLRATTDIRASGTTSAQGGRDVVGAGDRLFATNTTALNGAFELTDANIDAKASGAITMAGAVSAGRDARLQTVGTGTITVAGVDAGRDILLDGASVTTGALRAASDIAVRGRTGSVTLASATAGDDVVLRAAQDVNVTGAVSAQGGTDSVGAGDRLFAVDGMSLAGALDLAGSNVDAKASGAITMAGAVSAGRDARFQTVGAGAIKTVAVTAGRDVFADAASVQSTGQLSAGGDVALRGRVGDVQVASITAGDDIAVRAAGAFGATGGLSSGSAATSNGAADRLVSAIESGMIFRVVDPTANTGAAEGFSLGAGDIDIRSGGAIGVKGAITAAGDATVALQSTGKTTVSAITAGKAIFVRGADLEIMEAWKTALARIESTAAGGVALGANAAGDAGAMAISDEQFNRIDAATVQVFAGDTSGAARGSSLTIGALNVDTAKIRTALELYAGDAAEVRINGAFAPSNGTANSTLVRIGAATATGNWTPKGLKVIANTGGSIGASTTTNGRDFSGIRAFGSVELNATGDILMGYQDFIDKLLTTSAAEVANAVKAVIAPQGANGPYMLLTAGSLTLRANGKIAQQDTSSVGSLTRTGIYLTGSATNPLTLTLGRTSTATDASTLKLPEFIELYGAVNNGSTVLANENVALSNLIVFDNGVTPGQYYRLNTCVIFQQGNCSPTGGAPNLNIAPDRLTGLNLVDRTNTLGAADPTVASATNEEIWSDTESEPE